MATIECSSIHTDATVKIVEFTVAVLMEEELRMYMRANDYQKRHLSKGCSSKIT